MPSTPITIDAQRGSIAVEIKSSSSIISVSQYHRLYRLLSILAIIVFGIFSWTFLHFLITRIFYHYPIYSVPPPTTTKPKSPQSGTGGVIYPLNITCNSTLYPSLFYNDTCSPAFCSVVSDTTTPTCTYTATTYSITKANQDINRVPCRQCTVAQDKRCSSITLQNLLGNQKGIYAAFCNDKYLVVYSDGSTGSIPNLDNIPLPPGGTQNGQSCRTRMASYVGYSGHADPSKYLLCPTMLSTSNGSNNLAAFPDGPKDSPYGYLYNPPYIYGLPSGGGVGTTIAGQQIFPTFNNRALYTPENCEVDHCNQHVGQGGGFPHIHGDSFGPHCLYSEANYTTLDVHPPQIGWSFDGYDIYGRYLSENAPGYTTALDDCGGHIHDDYAYHYHTQVLTLTSTGALQKVAKDLTYAGSTVGPHKCWKADISKDVYFWSNSSDRYATAPCCGATQYYAQSGITINGAGTQSFTPITGSACSVAATPTPTTSPTASKTTTPTPSPTTTTTTTSTITTTPTTTITTTSTITATGTITVTPTASLSMGASISVSSTPTGTITTTGTPSTTITVIPTTTTASTKEATVTPSTKEATVTPSSNVDTSQKVSVTGTPSTSSIPIPIMTVDIALHPAANASMVLGTEVGTTIRRALGNATGLNPSLILITSIITGSTVVNVPANHAINNVLTRRLLLDESNTINFSIDQSISRKLTDDATIVTSELRVPSTMSTTSIDTLKTTVQAIESGTITAAAAGLNSISNVWGSSLGVPPQPIGVTSTVLATASSPSSTSEGLSTGAIVGIVIGSIAAVGILGAIYIFINGSTSSSIFSKGANKAVSPETVNTKETPVIITPDSNLSLTNPLTIRNVTKP